MHWLLFEKVTASAECSMGFTEYSEQQNKPKGEVLACFL